MIHDMLVRRRKQVPVVELENLSEILTCCSQRQVEKLFWQTVV